jgi:DNA-binding transcriptional MerR regulator
MKQAEKVYLISDAAKLVQVENHVLRYWEEELQLPIARNEMGHRSYTKEDINRFIQIRDLKEQGLQLKAIRTIIGKGNGEMAGEEMKRHIMVMNKGEFMPVAEESKEAKSLRLQQLLQNMIVEAVKSNNREVCEEIKETVLKELDYQFRLQEEREEEREESRTNRQEEYYRQLDELLRARNKSRAGRKNSQAAGQSEAAFLQENRQQEGKQKEKKRLFGSHKTNNL